MKGITGIVVAIGLGIAGALANLFYLHSEAQKVETVSFIGVKKSVNSGERLLEDNLVEVKIPKDHVGNLVQFAYAWEALKSVTGAPVWRALDCSKGAVLLLQTDIQTPHKELVLQKGERAECVPVPRTFITKHINPGDKVSFRFWNTVPAPTPARANKDSAPAATAADPATTAAGDSTAKPEAQDAGFAPAEPSDPIGPFVVMAIGTRLDSEAVTKAAKIPQSQENVLVIRVSKNVPREEENYNKLQTRLHGTGQDSYSVSIDSKD
jgi:hypothetical protein